MATIKMLYKAMNKISDILQKPLEFLSALCLFGGLLALFFQVIYRYIIVKFFSFSFPFTEEFARFTIIWFTYLSCGVSLKEGGMITLYIFSDKMPKLFRTVLYFATRILMVVFCIVVIRYGFGFLPSILGYRSVMLGMPGILLYGFPIFGCAMMLYETIVEALGVICGEIELFGNRLKVIESEEAVGDKQHEIETIKTDLPSSNYSEGRGY